MTAGFVYALWQKRTGMVAMLFLAAALLALADALVGGFLGERGAIELIPGNRYAISGPLPPNTSALKDFVIEGQPQDNAVRLEPEVIFSGYLFGGAMWRGALVVAPQAREGRYLLTVKDRRGERQNPALVFKVRVWPDEAALKANAPSWLTRTIGLDPFFIATGLAGAGLLMVGVHYLLGRLWARHLAAFQCGEIYKVRCTPEGMELTCELRCNPDIQPGMACAIYNVSGTLLSQAKVFRCDHDEVQLLVGPERPVRLGDIACLRHDPLPPPPRA